MAEAGVGLFKKTGKFLREVRAELKKVTWPTRRELTTYTIVVLVSVALVGGIIWIADTILVKLLSLIIG